jgi:hypothetical protein
MAKEEEAPMSQSTTTDYVKSSTAFDAGDVRVAAVHAFCRGIQGGKKELSLEDVARVMELVMHMV